MSTDQLVARMDNADLVKLKVSTGKLLPKFKASVTDYTVTLSSSEPELKLILLTSDNGASYAIKVSTLTPPTPVRRFYCPPAGY